MTLLKPIAVATLLGIVTMTACGNDEPEATDDTGSVQTDQPSGAPSGAPGLGDVDLEAIQQCLTAAGLDDAMPTDMPTDMPSDLPTDRPTDRPTDMPTDMPSDFPTDGTLPEGVPSGGPGGGMGALADPEVQAALEACGIDLPQAPTADQS